MFRLTSNHLQEKNIIRQYFVWSNFFLTFVNSSIIVQFIQKNPTRCNCISKFIIPYLYEAQHVSGDTSPIIRNPKLHWQPLVFHTWKAVGRVAGGLCQTVPESFHQPHVKRTFHVWKTRGCQCSFRLLMMGGVSPETC